MSRRPGYGARANRRLIGQPRIVVASGPATALTYVAGAKVLSYVRADLGITLNGSDVAAWADQHTTAQDWAQGTPSAQPVYDASGGVNGTARVRYTLASAESMTTALSRVAPATENFAIWAVVANKSDVTNNALIMSNNSRFQVSRRGGFNQWKLLNPTTVYGAGPVSPAPHRLYVLFTGVGADIVYAGSTLTTGLNTGNDTGSSPFHMCGIGGLGDMDVYEFMMLKAALSAGEQTDLDTYVTTRYGAGLV